MNILDNLMTEIEGHYYDYTHQDIGFGACTHVDHKMAGYSSRCWKASLRKWFQDNPAPEISNAPADKVQEIVAGLDPGTYVTKFLVIAEGLDPQGQRALYAETSDDMSTWDEMGMLQWGLAMNMNQMIHGKED